MSRLWRHLLDRLAGPPAPPPVPADPPPTPVPAGAGWPRTFGPAAPGSGSDRPRLFDPALKQYTNAFRPGDPTFADPADGRRWADQRRRATDHVLRAVAESAWGDRLILRGSRLLRAWLGAAAREPGDLDWVADPPAARPDDPWAVEMFAGVTAAVLARPAPPGVAFDPGGVATDDIWTYERAPGRRVVFPWRADGLPGGAVQVDVVFGEELSEPARRASVPAADGGCVSVRAAGPVQSLAWKLLWLMTDMHPQGKDLYDAVLLAERFRLPFDVLDDALRRGEAGPPPVTSAGLTRDWQVDWDNFRAEYPDAGGDAAGWLLRLETALRPTFAGVEPADRGPGDASAGPAADPSWLTSTVVSLARGIDTDLAFDRLPVLADALEDAGCADEDVLAHCRGGGPHARGCVVVDFLLGRE
ncbi:MAG: hypothetical protein JWO38_5714 [Gemmataceae bacterium]|nr:hypothetical protein [Gemmataceae bacterium]